MRTVIVIGVVAFVVGLAAQWLPRALGGDAAADRTGDVPTLPMRSTTGATQSSDLRAANASVASSEVELAEDRPEDSGMSAVSSAQPQRERVTELISVGFTPERAQEIVRKESELRRAAIEQEYVASGTIRPLNAASPSAVELQMRSWMGDSEYEQYLKAIGQTTRIHVGDVESDSVAANAGIVSGDEILTYAGRRVFNLRDLNALMLQTPEGETVSTRVVRGGQEMELYVTGGPLGISQAPEPRTPTLP
jgi:C-terminal processing protease CtpA/Prc